MHKFLKNYKYTCQLNLETITDYKSARGFKPRQYSDFFSLLFGDEDKENSTAVAWDYEAETESINTEQNATNEKDLLDVINDSLKYADTSKQSAEKQANVPNQTYQPVPNLPNHNISADDDDGENNGGGYDDDEEEISLLDFFLKGDSALTTTTVKPFVFNITGKPLLNGMTNSPMQIQPVLPDNMKNESLKFSMLPMSLYNMVKEDGSLIFDSEKNQTQETIATTATTTTTTTTVRPSISPDVKHTNKDIQSEQISTQKSETTSVSISNSDIKTTTNTPKTSTVKSITKDSKIKFESNNLNAHSPNHMSQNINKTESVNIKNVVKKIESTTKKVIQTSPTNRIPTTARPKSTTTTSAHASTTKSSETTEKIGSTTKHAPSKKITNAPKIVTSTAGSTIETTSSVSTTVSLQPLTTTTSRATYQYPKITAVQVNSNPSILETDLSYDYSEPTLPPSLPNLKIIPFLPTDAVKNIIHKNDAYKSNYNYYQTNPNKYANHEEVITENSAISPFNIKPSADKYPNYSGSVADDRIDYDTYKAPSHGTDSLDYIYAISGDGGVGGGSGSGNMIQPSSFQLSVNSKLDYGSPQKAPGVIKVPSVVNKNLTVKPPLPPFEPEHEYGLYNSPPKPQLPLENSYNEYSVNGPFSPEHNYNVPHFVTMPPLKESPHRPITNKDTVFSYSYKNKFIPPAKTEGEYFDGIKWILIIKNCFRLLF